MVGGLVSGEGWILMEKGYEEFADCGNNLDIVGIFIPPKVNHGNLIYKSFEHMC